MRATIEIAGLSLFAHHGATEAEQRTGQRFLLDLKLEIDADAAVRGDKLAETVDYAEVTAVAQAAFLERRFNLIEAVAGHVAAAVLAHFPKVARVRVKVTKPSAPVPAVIEHVAATVEKRRDG
jgi:dihydroneopterin aldolase